MRIKLSAGISRSAPGPWHAGPTTPGCGASCHCLVRCFRLPVAFAHLQTTEVSRSVLSMRYLRRQNTLPWTFDVPPIQGEDPPHAYHEDASGTLHKYVHISSLCVCSVSAIRVEYWLLHSMSGGTISLGASNRRTTANGCSYSLPEYSSARIVGRLPPNTHRTQVTSCGRHQTSVRLL